jgi:membrane-associated phospholipid phosphatase
LDDLGEFVRGAAPFVVAAVAYEALRGLVRLRHDTDVHVGALAALDASLFSVDTGSGSLPLTDLVSAAPHPVLDVICGVAYLLFLPELFGLAVYFFFTSRPRMLQVSLGFLLTNLLGWGIWLLYPAAPPWYVDAFGTGPVVLDAASSPAGIARLDSLVGLPIAATFYAQSANVFGAMPSLHVAYPTMVALVCWPLGGRLRVATVVYAAVVAYAAVYLRHHYVLDVVAGLGVAVAVWPLLLRLSPAERTAHELPPPALAPALPRFGEESPRGE